MCCFWPGLWFAIVWSVLAIIRGTEILNEHKYVSNPKTIIILQIIQAFHLDLINVVMGIISLVFVYDSEVRSYFRRQDW
jgi:uncharacterized membrane protein